MKKLLLLLLVSTFLSCEKQDGLLDMDAPGNLVPKTADEDSLLPSITVNGTTLHAETFGDIQNPIIVFLHGGPGGDYRAMISEFGAENASRYPSKRTINNGGLTRLQDEYFLVIYDQRSAGLSKRYDDVNMDTYVLYLDAVIDYYINKKEEETGITDTQVHLFGWSF